MMVNKLRPRSWAIRTTALCAAAVLALSGCGPKATTVAEFRGVPGDPCTLYLAANAATEDPTNRWVAAGRPANSADRDAIRAAVQAAPDLYQAAWESATDSMRLLIGPVLSAARERAAEAAETGSITESTANRMAIAQWTAGDMCPKPGA